MPYKTLAEFDQQFPPEFIEESDRELDLLKIAVASRQLLEQSGLPQREVAKRMGHSSPSTLQRILQEEGEGANVELDTLARFARACGHRLEVKYVPLKEGHNLTRVQEWAEAVSASEEPTSPVTASAPPPSGAAVAVAASRHVGVRPRRARLARLTRKTAASAEPARHSPQGDAIVCSSSVNTRAKEHMADTRFPSPRRSSRSSGSRVMKTANMLAS